MNRITNQDSGSEAMELSYAEFNENGLMVERIASINDAPINENDRRVF